MTQLSSDSFIGGEYWISHEVGLNDEFWRGAAEGNVDITTESGLIKVPAIYIPNKKSVYRLMSNQVKDIVKQQGYFDKLSPYLQAVGDDYTHRMAGFYNDLYNEYWLQLANDTDEQMFTFAQNTDKWQGRFDYRYDQFVQINNKLFGMKDLRAYNLDEGYQINGANIEFELLQNTSPLDGFEMEFIRVQVNSDKKPTKIEFLDESETVLCSLEQATQGPLYLKDYDGWEQFIPRIDGGVDPDRKRIQSRLLIYKIFHNLAEDFKVISSIVQFKKLK